MTRIISAFAAGLALLITACANPNYEEPLAQFGRGPAAPTESPYKGLTLGVVYNDNSKKAADLVDKERMLGVVALAPMLAADLDSSFLPKSIDDVLRRRFKDVRRLERPDVQNRAGLDAVMVVDLQVKLGAGVRDVTSVTIQGFFMDDAQSPIAQIKGEGVETIPSFAMSPHFTLAATQAIQRFAQALDGSTELASKLALSTTVAFVPNVSAPPPSPSPSPASPGNLEGRRVALVIGNASYRNVPRLANTTTDARLVAATLKNVGFELVGGGPLLDLDRATFIKALTTFGDRLQGSTVGVFYYAGHGLQMQGANFLVPVEANPTRPSDADVQLVDAAFVLRQMEDSRANLKIVILDACRNNPFGGRGLRDAAGGLAQMRAPEGTVISYATQPGNVAQDGDAGGDSPYTVALARSIVTPGLDVLSMFNEVGVQVDTSTKGFQQPWLASSPIRGKFYFTK